MTAHSFRILRSAFLGAFLVALISNELVAQQIQPPAFQITIPNSPGYTVDTYSINIFKSQSTQASYGIILYYEKPLRVDEDGNTVYDQQSLFVWLDSQGKLIALWRAPEPFPYGKVVSLTSSRAVILDPYGGGETTLHYLIRSGKSIVHRIAESLSDPSPMDGSLPGWSIEQMVRHGFVRVSQSDNLDKTTIEYFTPW